MNDEIKQKLQALGVAGAILITVLSPTALDSGQTPNPNQGKAGIVIGDRFVEVDNPEFEVVKGNLRTELQNTGKIDIMELYGSGNVKTFLPVLNAELKKRQGKFTNKRTDQIIDELLSPRQNP